MVLLCDSVLNVYLVLLCDSVLNVYLRVEMFARWLSSQGRGSDELEEALIHPNLCLDMTICDVVNTTTLNVS